MKHSKALLKVPGAFACKMPNWICSCLVLLLAVFLVAVASPGKANAAGETGTLSAVSPPMQQLKLSDPTSSALGGRGYMSPQTVVARDSSGKPLAGIPVTFEVFNKDPIVARMRPYNETVITVITDAAGNASAANVNPGYVGEGYQVYSQIVNSIQTLQVTASAPGFNTVTFNVEVGAVGAILLDTTPPYITVSAKNSIGASYLAGTWTNCPVTVHFSAKDSLSSLKSCSPDQVFQNEGANQTATGTAVDSADNSASITFGPINIDKDMPVSTATITDSASNGWYKGTVSIRFDAMDSLSGVDAIYYQVGANAPVKITGSSYTAQIDTAGINDVSYWSVDKAGNVEAAKSINIKVDNAAPSITGSQSPAKNANGWNNSNVMVTLTAADACSGVKEIRYKIGTGAELVVSGSTASLTVSAEGTTTVTFWAVDNVGYTGAQSTLDMKIDKTPPTVIPPPNQSVEATAVNTPVSIGSPIVTEQQSTYTLKNDAPAGGFPIGVTRVTWTATDAAGNVTSAVQTVTVADTTPPSINVHGDIAVEATGVRTPVVLSGTTATDIFPYDIENDAPADFPIGITTVTWTATDANGNHASGTQNVTVTDTTNPLLTVPGDITKEATGRRTPVVIGQAVGNDIFEVTIRNNAPEDFPVGTTNVTWTATDANGNVTTEIQKITVTDMTKPVLTVPQDITVEANERRTKVNIGQATATDIFDVNVTCDAPADYPVGTTQVTWKATDANGNVTAKVQNITVTDTTKPVITIPADGTFEATAVRTSPAIGTATATDIFDVTITNNAPADFPVGTTEVAWKATDANGNFATGVQFIKIVDTTKPVLTVPADKTVEATAVRTPVQIGTATATDIFGATVTNDAPADYPLGDTVVTWSARDPNGNVSTAAQKITIVDTTAPALTLPVDITKEATALMTPVNIGQATATDIFLENVTNDAPAEFPIGTRQVTWTATDTQGNVTKKVQKINIVDTTKPVLTVPADKTVEATAVRTPVTIGQATATDIFPVTITNDAPVDFPIGTTTVTWTATDANGNTTIATQEITIVDTTKPVITAPADINAEATAVRSLINKGQATATDIFPVTVTNDAPADFPLGMTTVTWTATDANGNASTAVQKITIVDTTKPVLTVPQNITVEATALRTPVTIGQATATDIFPVTVTSDAPADFPLGTTTVTWTAADENGNVTTGVQTIKIVDTTSPVITAPADKTVEATAVKTPVDVGTAAATDIFPVTVTSDAPADYSIGTTVVTWKATDTSGNTSKAEQKIIITDTTRPVLTVPADMTVEATAVRTPVSIGHATATDIFAVTVTNNAPADFPIGTTPVTWTATDINGNSTTKVQNITIVDTTKPVLTVPADMTVEATAVRTPVSIGKATATDIFPVTITSDAPADFPLGITTVTWTATDTNGNAVTGVQKITIVDTTKPVFTSVPADMTVEATAVNTPVTIGQATATDIFPVTVTSDAPAVFPLGTTTVTWTATDANGNVITATQKITIVDTTKPVFTSVPADMTVEATAVDTSVIVGQAAATDIFPVTVVSDAPAVFPIGTTVVTWTAADANGNAAAATQKITIVDTTPPKFVTTPPLNISKEANAVRTLVDIGLPTTSDIFPVTLANDAPADFPLGTTQVTWTLTDAIGNVNKLVQTVVIVDTTKPVLTVPADMTVEASALRTQVAIGQATATDIFDVTVKNDAPADYPLGTTKVTWTATDTSGNVSTRVQSITIVDTTKPVITVPADMTVEAAAVNTPVTIGQATATDIFPVTITSDAPASYPIGTTTVTWKATDANGNFITKEQKIIIIDTTKPVLTLPADITFEATALRTPVIIGQATATDIFPVTVTKEAPADYPLGTTEVTWTATDANGNVTTGIQKITIVDTTKPVITVPADIVTEATAVLTPVDIGKCTATDIFALDIKNDAPAVFPIGTTTVTWTAADVNGNVTTGVQKVSIVDTTKPVLSMPADITKEATAIRTPVDIGQAVAIDIFPSAVKNNAPADYPIGTTIVTWTATDAHGNVTTGDQKVTIVDTTKPVLTIPADMTVEATAIRTPVVIGQATATDIFPVTVTNDAPKDYPIGTTEVTWTATDANGNVTTKVQKITVVDTTKPVFTKVPADMTLEATARWTPVDIGEPIAIDIFPVTVTHDAPADYSIGMTPVTWIATDANGNSTTGVQKITIVDTTKPVLTVPADVTVEATAVRTPVNIGQATATDIFTVIITNDAPKDYPIGTTIVTWTATDENGNVATKTQKVTIIDTTAPVFATKPPITITREATAVRTPVDIGQATATDIFPVTVVNNAPADYPLGTTEVKWTATDANGNVSILLQTVTITDTTKPVLTVPADMTIEATAVRTPVTIGQATATDIFPVTVISDAPKDYPIGTTTVTWTATDANNNVTTGVQKITIVDTTKPVFTAVPADMTVEATAVRTPVTIGQATATDIFPVTVISDAPADYPIGTTTVTWTATDANGNVSTATQKITITDTTKPVFTKVPADMTVEATAIKTPVGIGNAIATDIFPVTVTNDDPKDYPIGTTTVTWTATDANGNVTTAVQKITIVDTTKPTLAVPADMTVEATAVRTPVVIGEAPGNDIFPITATNDAPKDYPIGTTTVTWTATDANGNTTTGTQKITIVDTTKPVFTAVPADMTVEATAVQAPVNIGQATATDIFPVTVTNDAPKDYPIGTTEVIWTATDANGNVTTATQKITIVDTTKPVFTSVPADMTVEATAVLTPVNIGQAIATDIFPVTVKSNAPVDFSLGTTEVTWTATDANGNVTTTTQKITIQDTTKPALTVPADITKEATAVRTPVTIGQATAIDIFPVTVTKEAPADYPIGTTEVKWTVTDANGNVTTGIQKITIVDTTKPVITVPADITKEATAVRTPLDLGKYTATDIFALDVRNDAPVDFPIGTTIVTWTITDENGNVTTGTQKVTIVDTTKPVFISVPADMAVEATAIRTPVDIGQATATDIFPVTVTNNAPVDFPIGTTEVTWTATDANGNATTAVQKIKIVDTTKPVFASVPADMTVEATAIRTPVDIGQATATDIFPVTVTSNAPADYPIGTTEVTWTATDANGNVTTAVQKITIVDTTKPVLTVPADMTVEAMAVQTPVTIGKATATDIFPVSVTSDAPASYPIGTIEVIWTAIDANGNVATAVQKITIVDTTKPVLTIPADITKEATAVRTPVDLGSATATDIFPVTITNDALTDYPLGTTLVTWTATDANGNVTTIAQKITIVDTTPPRVVSFPRMTITNVEANAVATTFQSPVEAPVFTDIFPVTVAGGSSSWTATDTSGNWTTVGNNAPADYHLGTTVVTWTATDSKEGILTAAQTITVVDTTKPVLTAPADMTVEATAIKTPVDIGQATATDIFPVTVKSDAPAAYPLGTTIVTWTATDANGNVSTAEQKVTVIDTTKPVLTVPADITKEATAVQTPITIGQATATDIFPVTITNDAPADYPFGTTIVTWTATDANNNVTTAEQKITVIDTTKPVLTVPEDKTVEATAVRTPVYIGEATVIDIFETVIANDAPADYPIGTTTVTWMSMDEHQNDNSGTQKITVIDTTKPVLTVPADMTVEATAVRTPVVIGQATATDIFPVTITNDAPADYPIGTTTVTWTATDANGNSSTAVQNITITDKTNPLLTVPADMTVEATAVRTQVSIGHATATDIFTVTVTNDAPADFPLGTTIVTWTATDENGNVTTATQKITVIDTTKPVLTIPADITVEATALRTPVETGNPMATDIFPVTVTNDAPADYPVGTTTVTWTATDENGNVTTATQKITVTDTTKPVLTVPANKTVYATGTRTAVAIGTATATDIFPVTITNDAPADYPVGTTTVTWTATDANGNVSTAVQTVTVLQKVRMQSYNNTRNSSTRTMEPRFKLYNTAGNTINLSDVKLRYYFTGDAKAQTVQCTAAYVNGSSINRSYVTVSIKSTSVPGLYYIEVGFASSAGTLRVGGNVQVNVSATYNDRSYYTQSNDYSFNPTATTFADTAKVTVYLSGTLISGTEP